MFLFHGLGQGHQGYQGRQGRYLAVLVGPQLSPVKGSHWVVAIVRVSCIRQLSIFQRSWQRALRPALHLPGLVPSCHWCLPGQAHEAPWRDSLLPAQRLCFGTNLSTWP